MKNDPYAVIVRLRCHSLCGQPGPLRPDTSRDFSCQIVEGLNQELIKGGRPGGFGSRRICDGGEVERQVLMAEAELWIWTRSRAFVRVETWEAINLQ